MKIISKYILPAALVAGFLYYFFYDILHYRVIADDCFYNAMLSNYGVGGCISGCYNIANGRWFSHIVCAFSFYFLKYNFSLYAGYLVFLASLFVIGITSLYKNYRETFFQIKTSLTDALLFGFVFTSTLYFLLFEGRWEIWGWVSSANNHLLSVIICTFLFSLIIRARQNFRTYSGIIIFSAFVGGLNEVNAVCSAALAIVLVFMSQIKLNRAAIFLSVLSIALSLAVNIYSGGYKIRMEGLPEFTMLQSLKNTMHTFLIPFFHYQYLSFFLGAMIIFFLFIKQGSVKFKALNIAKKQIPTLLSLVFIAVLSFFLHCYTLSDIVPPRGELWGYCFMLFIFFTFIGQKTNRSQDLAKVARISK